MRDSIVGSPSRSTSEEATWELESTAKTIRHDRVNGVLVPRAQVFALTDEQARREAQDKMMAETSEDLWAEIECKITETGT